MFGTFYICSLREKQSFCSNTIHRKQHKRGVKQKFAGQDQDFAQMSFPSLQLIPVPIRPNRETQKIVLTYADTDLLVSSLIFQFITKMLKHENVMKKRERPRVDRK